jgi:L-ascorbate metabolism protein UlaG (beta-lactamase superfamily)
MTTLTRVIHSCVLLDFNGKRVLPDPLVLREARLLPGRAARFHPGHPAAPVGGGGEP